MPVAHTRALTNTIDRQANANRSEGRAAHVFHHARTHACPKGGQQRADIITCTHSKYTQFSSPPAPLPPHRPGVQFLLTKRHNVHQIHHRQTDTRCAHAPMRAVHMQARPCSRTHSRAGVLSPRGVRKRNCIPHTKKTPNQALT
eukprot:Tamp_32408.p2 GENE.Tamp_32408~~Tamp_32408.p2  ORF type:complete len:144 (+),score=8.10 Tamp_32408:112-543(+)